MFRKLSAVLTYSIKFGSTSVSNGRKLHSSIGLVPKFSSSLRVSVLPVCHTVLPCIEPPKNENIVKDPFKITPFLVPVVPSFSILDNPCKNESSVIKDPSQTVEKFAERMIVIRRNKMKRHRLKKLRKKMKFEWAKRRQRREMKKEKAFQAELMGKITEAKKFDPVAYAAEQIRLANEVKLPTRWRGKRLPEFVIKELIEKRDKKRQDRLESIERRKNMDLDPSHYKF